MNEQELGNLLAELNARLAGIEEGQEAILDRLDDLDDAVNELIGSDEDEDDAEEGGTDVADGIEQGHAD